MRARSVASVQAVLVRRIAVAKPAACVWRIEPAAQGNLFKAICSRQFGSRQFGSGQFGYGCGDDRLSGCPSSGMTMDQAEQLSELIGEVYDAALDPSLWSDVLGKAGRFVGGPAAAIYSRSPTALTGNLYYESGTDPHYRALYFSKYIKFDPSTTSRYFADVEQPIILGVAESTIKTHLGNLFLKTGARRQADLVKIVTGFATPLIG
jgi:hypothetical protein